MKLWDVVAVCLVLLHTASAFPLPAGKRPPEAPAEDRSLGRRRAPFALSSDCKNRSLPAGGPPTDPYAPPPAARTHSKAARMALWSRRPGGRAALALKPPPGASALAAGCCPKPSRESIRFLCCLFSIPVNGSFPHHYHHHRKTHSCPFFSASPSPIHIYMHHIFLSSKALYLFGCVWRC